MEIKRTQLQPKGMSQDLSISKFNPEFSYENRNIRITSREDSSLLSITNERGNKKYTNFTLIELDPRANNVVSVKYTLTPSRDPLGIELKMTLSSQETVKSTLTFNFAVKGYDDKNQELWTYNNIATLAVGQNTVEIAYSITKIASDAKLTSLILSEDSKEDEYYFYYLSDLVNPKNSDIVPEKHPYIESAFNGDFVGTVIGKAILNDYLILFTHSSNSESPDRIYRIEALDRVMLLYEGNLNFSKEHLIDTLPIYESEEVQKVYWTDSLNQPRVINFINDPEPEKWNNSTYFDFLPEVGAYSFIDVVKNDNGGEFAPGSIQYAYTYITEDHGVETNIVDTSDLYYISYNDRAGKGDETCYNSFSIHISGLNPRFKYIRIYSLHRTSLDATPTVKVLGEYEIQTPENLINDYWDLRTQVNDIFNSLSVFDSLYYKKGWYTELPKIDPSFDTLSEKINEKFQINIGSIGNGSFTKQSIIEYIWKANSYYVDLVDTGTLGTTEDSQILLYKNSPEAIINTLATKDETLFVGGYTIPSDAQSTINSIKLYNSNSIEYLPIGITTITYSDADLDKVYAKFNFSEATTSKITLSYVVERYNGSTWEPRITLESEIPVGATTIQFEIPDGSILIDRVDTQTVNIVQRGDDDYYKDSYHIYYIVNKDLYPETEVISGQDGAYSWGYRDFIKIEDSQAVGTYTYTPYTLKKGTNYCKQFKKGQPYRFALQGQYANGRWGDPILISNLEDAAILRDEETGEFLIESSSENLYTLDNTCENSFLIDPVLPQELTPIYTLCDVVTTSIYPELSSGIGYESNLITTSSGNLRYWDTKLKNPPLPESYLYFPTHALFYKDANIITPSSNLDVLKMVGDVTINPWEYIYNKDYFLALRSSTSVTAKASWKNLTPHIKFNVNYKINSKYFYSMWAGFLKNPTISNTFYLSPSVRTPDSSHKATSIETSAFDGGFTTLYLNKLSIVLSKETCSKLLQQGYKRVRLLYVKPTEVNRKYPAQGIVTNTLFIPRTRAVNSSWAYTDYLSRPKSVYRVWNERSAFMYNWQHHDQTLTRMNDYSGASPWTSWKVAHRLIDSPYYFPFIHRYWTEYNTDFTSWYNVIWEDRLNYGHLASTFHEIETPFESEATFDTSASKKNSVNFIAKQIPWTDYGAYTYDPSEQEFTPCITVESLTKDDRVYFDESIVDFWSPDIEFNESLKNYYEHTVEGFQIRGMTNVVSTTNSLNCLKENGTRYTLLGFSDVNNYYPYISLEQSNNKIDKKYTAGSAGGADISMLDYFTLWYSGTSGSQDIFYLPSTQFTNLSSGVHRLAPGASGNWSISDVKKLNTRIWANSVDNKNKENVHSYKKYCLNTLLFKDLTSLKYNINQPTLFIKGDTIKPISLYKTSYSGEDVTYNPGMDELLLAGSSEITSSVLINYNANTHLTFSLSKGKLFEYTNLNNTLQDRNLEAYPVMPELSAYAKQESTKTIGRADGQVIFLYLYWWPSKSSIRPDIYSDEAYSVTESRKRGEWETPFKVALQSSAELPVSITVEFTYRLEFWKAEKKSKLGTSTITLPAGKVSALKKFIQDWLTLRDWSTIEIKSFKIKSISGNWNITGDYSATNNSSSDFKVVLLMNNQTYINSEELVASDPFWIGNRGLYVKDLIDPIQGEILAPEYDNVDISSIIYHRNLPHFLLVDLVRSDAFIYNDWQGSGIYQQVWTPCGKPVILPIDSDEGCVVEATEGDVYVGRYDCLRVSTNEEQSQRINDIVSFICESYINPDGRSDVNRYTTDTRYVNFDNFNLINKVYSQSNNYFNYTKNDYRILSTLGKFPNQFSWTLTKQPNSLVDSWTNLTFASVYNLNGEYGKLTKIVMHNNQLYAFQDKAISNILFNTRVQVPVSDGLPIELSNSNKVDGVRYITTTSGAQNKWSINTSRSGIYYIDHLKKCLNLISSEGIKDITGSTGFTQWSLNNLGYSTDELSLANGMSNWIISIDPIHDDVYIHDKNECLNFSERLASFTSFFDYKDIPFMDKYNKDFISLYSVNDISNIYIQNTGEYNKFFDSEKVPSYIDYIVNPEPYRDKVFNNIEFRADAFDAENDYTKYIPNRTLDHIHVRNEFQDTGDVPLIQYKNLQKKFRIWRAYIPRDTKEMQNYKLNRIRNPWIKLKLSYTPTESEDNKVVLHDLIVNYTV